MINDDEKVNIKIAIYFIVFGGLPQFIFAFSLITGAGFLDGISIHPGAYMAMLFVPAFLFRKLIMLQVLKGKSRDEKTEHIDDWFNSAPKLFMFLPILQFHSGVFFLYKLAIIVMIRHAQGKKDPCDWFRNGCTYLINQTDYT